MIAQAQPICKEQKQPNTNTPLLLIYYNFKGAGQAIRYLLCHLKIPFLDIFLDEYASQKKTLPISALEALKSKSINKKELPAIIHNDQIITCYNQCINYICITFDREDLLGVDIYQKARVCQIQQIYSLKLPPAIQYVANFIKEISKITDQSKILPFIESSMDILFRQSGYLKELSTYLLRQQDQSYILNNLTAIDFYFIESARHIITIFGCIDQQLASGHWIQDAKKFRLDKEEKGERVQYIENLRAMKKFVQYMFSQPFYLDNQKYLESFRSSPETASTQQKQGMKKLFANHFMDLYYDSQ